MPANSPLLLLLGVLLLAAHASPVAAGVDSFVDGGSWTATVNAARTTASETWQRRRLEEEVAPEFPSAAVGPPGIGTQVFNPDNGVCVNNCAGKGPGDNYTQKRGCYIADNCRHQPPQ